MNRRHRILHLITRLELGGAQQNTLFCVRNHDRRRFDVGLIAGAGGMLDDEARAIPDATVQIVPWLKHEIAPVTDLLAVLRLRAYFKEARIDLVHTHSSKAGILGRLAAFLAGVPVVVHTVHGWSFNPTQSSATRRLYTGLERISARLTDRIYVVAGMHRETGLALGIGRPEIYRVVRSGIDAAAYRASGSGGARLREELGCGPDDVLIGTVTCLKPQKAPVDFVKAAAEACSKNDRLRFAIAGDGPLRPQVEAAIREYGLEGRCFVLGWRRDIPDLLSGFDLFLLTSVFEGLPRAVLQAMAARLPVVATAVDGTPEVVEHERTGLLVPPGQPELAARAILRLADDPESGRQFAAEAERRLTAEFDVQKMVDTLERSYLSLLPRRRRPALGRGGMMVGGLA